METLTEEARGGPPASDRPRVTITHGPGEGTSFYLEQTELLIGRAQSGTQAQVALIDPTVSRAHARLVRTARGYALEDLGSANGTALNYARLGEPRLLQDGDLIKVGGTVLVYRMVTVAAAPAGRGEGRIVTLFGLKGGVGRTTLAVNLALRLRALTGEAVLLADLSLEQGAVASHLNLSVRRGLHELAQLEGAAAEGLGWAVAHHASGLDVLPAPTEPEHAEQVTAALVGSLVPALRARFRWIVVDLAPTFSDLNLSLLDQTDWLWHVTAPDVPALRSAQAAQAVFARLGHTAGQRQLVLNGLYPRTRLDRRVIEDSLGARLDLALPYSEAVLESLNKGVPLAMSAPTDPLIQALDGWVRRVADVPEVVAPPPRSARGFWPRFKSSAPAEPMPV